MLWYWGSELRSLGFDVFSGSVLEPQDPQTHRVGTLRCCIITWCVEQPWKTIKSQTAELWQRMLDCWSVFTKRHRTDTSTTKLGFFTWDFLLPQDSPFNFRKFGTFCSAKKIKRLTKVQNQSFRDFLPHLPARDIRLKGWTWSKRPMSETSSWNCRLGRQCQALLGCFERCGLATLRE